MVRNIALYPWFKFVQSLSFWQATWFLYFEHQLSAAEAILLYVVIDITTTVIEVPSGYMSDKLGRRKTLLASAICGFAATLILISGGTFMAFAGGMVLLGSAGAFASGTDSALLYESLVAEGREAHIEAAELKAWRYSFIALALSAFSGGAMALYDDVLPYVATAISAFGVICVTCLFTEPPHAKTTTHREDLQQLWASLTHPTLLWLLGLTLLMYVFSHIPYIFGQPFIREALTTAGYGAQTPLVSGAVTFTMMLVSVAASLVALPLRNRIGLPAILMLAFAMQIALTAALASSNGLFVILLLFLRMVPDSFSQSFIKARIQPLLSDTVRATYMSVQSLAGRVLFAITLSIASAQTSDGAMLPYADMQSILTAYAVAGLIGFAVLLSTVRKAAI